MAICEDAPCCGCCGASVWAAEAQSAEEARFDMMMDFDDRGEWFEPDLLDPEECEHENRSGWEVTETTFFGYPVSLMQWQCDNCGELQEQKWSAQAGYPPYWMTRELRNALRRINVRAVMAGAQR